MTESTRKYRIPTENNPWQYQMAPSATFTGRDPFSSEKTPFPLPQQWCEVAQNNQILSKCLQMLGAPAPDGPRTGFLMVHHTDPVCGEVSCFQVIDATTILFKNTILFIKDVHIGALFLHF